MAENGSNSELLNLTPRQVKACQALLASKSIREAAEKSGTPERTLHRWMADADFRLALADLEVEALDGVTRHLLAASTKAVDTLVAILDSTEARDADRVKAATAILSHLATFRAQRDVEGRLLALEAALHGSQGNTQEAA